MHYIPYFLRSILARRQKISQYRLFLQDSRFL